MVAFVGLWAPPAELPGRERSTAPEQQTTSQLTPPAGEAGQQARQKPQMCHSWASKRPQDRTVAVRLVVLFMPLDQFALGIKGRRGWGGRAAVSQTDRKLFTVKAKTWRKRPFYSIPSCSRRVAQQVKDVCVCGGASLLRLWFGGVRLVLWLKLNRQLQTYRKGRAPWKGPGGCSSHLQPNGVSSARIRTLMGSICSLVSV